MRNIKMLEKDNKVNDKRTNKLWDGERGRRTKL